jgi:hypothetical protein
MLSLRRDRLVKRWGMRYANGVMLTTLVQRGDGKVVQLKVLGAFLLSCDD